MEVGNLENAYNKNFLYFQTEYTWSLYVNAWGKNGTLGTFGEIEKNEFKVQEV